MIKLSKLYGVAVAFGVLLAAGYMPASAQSLGDTLGGVVDGVTGGLGGGTGGTDGTTVTVGDSGTGATVGTSGIDGSGTNTNTSVGVGGNTLLGGLNLDNTNGTNAGATLGLVSPLLDGTGLNTDSLNASLGIPGVGTLNLNGSGTTLGVSLGTGGGGAPAGAVLGGGGAAALNQTLASLSSTDLAQLRLRCKQILSNPGAFDSDLVSLCKMIATSRR